MCINFCTVGTDEEACVCVHIVAVDVLLSLTTRFQQPIQTIHRTIIFLPTFLQFCIFFNANFMNYLTYSNKNTKAHCMSCIVFTGQHNVLMHEESQKAFRTAVNPMLWTDWPKSNRLFLSQLQAVNISHDHLFIDYFLMHVFCLLPKECYWIFIDNKLEYNFCFFMLF